MALDGMYWAVARDGAILAMFKYRAHAEHWAKSIGNATVTSVFVQDMV